MEKQKSNPVTIILIVVLLLTTIGFGGYFVYDKFIKEETPNVENNDGKEEKPNSETNNEKEEVTVIDGYTYVGNVEYNGTCRGEFDKITSANIKLPKVNSSKPNALLLNKRILEKFDDITTLNSTNNKHHLSNITIKYDFVIKDDLIVIYIIANARHYCGSGLSEEYYYYYDIKNDSILNLKEISDKLNFSKEQFIKKCDYSESFDFYSIETSGSGLKVADDKIVVDCYGTWK